MLKGIKIPEETWEILFTIKLRDKEKSVGSVIYTLLKKAKEVENNDTQSDKETDKNSLS